MMKPDRELIMIISLQFTEHLPWVAGACKQFEDSVDEKKRA